MPHSIGRNCFKIKAAADAGEAEILIYGDIGESWDDDSVEATQFVKDLAEVDASVITARINSYGGSVTDGLAIYNALRRHKATVHVEVDGLAASIASLIAMAGDVVHMAENARMMIHAPWAGVIGNARDMRDVADQLDGWAESMASAYTRAGMSHDDALALLKDGTDHWYGAQEALDAGLIDNITGALDVAARYQKNRFTEPKSQAASAAALTDEEAPMPKETPAAAPTEQPEINVVEIQTAAEAKARKDIAARNEQLRVMRGLASDPAVAELITDIIADPSVTMEQAYERIGVKMGEGAESLNRQPSVTPGVDQRDRRVEGMTNALMARMGAADQDRSNPWRGLRMSEVARACLEQAGVSVRGLTPEEFAGKALSPVLAAQTTSDFPVVLENTLHKLVLRGFNAQPSTYQRVAKIGDVTDFRAWNRLVPGMIGNLDGVDEHGAYKNKPLPDAEKNAITATRKGNIISVTPEVLVNDDIGYIQDLANALGMAGPRTIDRAFYTLLESNPTLSDGVALFHADHGNLAGSGTAISVDTLDAAAIAMALQTAPGDDNELLDIMPDIGVCNRAKYGLFTEVVNAEYNDETSKNQRKPNRVRGIVSDIVSTGRLSSTTGWYLFASPMVAPVIEVVFLNGQREPRVAMEENFRTAGLSWRVELPFGVGAIDYRGAYKNAGA